MTDEPLDLKDRRVIQWPWTIGGSNDGYEITPEIFRRSAVFRMLKGAIVEHDPSVEEGRIEDELYTRRRLTVGRTNLLVHVYAEQGVSDTQVLEQVWEQLCVRALISTEAERLVAAIPDDGNLAETLREAATDIRVNAKHPTDLATAESMQRTAQILGLIPTCPTCQRWLIFRQPHERFMENSQYVECANGHVFELVRTTDLPTRKTATEAIQQLATGTDELNKLHMEIARLLLEGKLYAGFETPDGMKFEQVTPPKLDQ